MFSLSTLLNKFLKKWLLNNALYRGVVVTPLLYTHLHPIGCIYIQMNVNTFKWMYLHLIGCSLTCPVFGIASYTKASAIGNLQGASPWPQKQSTHYAERMHSRCLSILFNWRQVLPSRKLYRLLLDFCSKKAYSLLGRRERSKKGKFLSPRLFPLYAFFPQKSRSFCKLFVRGKNRESC